jgi:phage antirepressor YoqD-like protein
MSFFGLYKLLKIKQLQMVNWMSENIYLTAITKQSPSNHQASTKQSPNILSEIYFTYM